MDERLEWVQIIEPKSKDVMYANLVTGECVWQAPFGAKIKHTDENQWWELFDLTTKRHYYYNSQNQRTVWQRPVNADIIPLAKLQMIKANTESIDEQTKMTSPISTINHMHQQLTTTNNIPFVMTNRWKQASLQGLDLTSRENKSNTSISQRSIRRTATAVHPNTIYSSATMNDPVSLRNSRRKRAEKPTFDEMSKSIQYPSHPPSINDTGSTQVTPSASQANPQEGQLISPRPQNIHWKSPFIYSLPNADDPNRPATTSLAQGSPSVLRQISSSSLDFLRNQYGPSMSLNRASFGRHNIRKKQPRTNPNYVNIQIKTDDGSLRSTYIRLSDISKCQTLALSSSSSSPSHSSSEQDSILDCSQSYSNESNGYCPSDETISSVRTNDIEKKQLSHQQQSSSNSDEDPNHFGHTLTNRAALGMKQLITYTDVLHRTETNVAPGRAMNSHASTISSPSTPMCCDDQSNSLSLSHSIEPYSMNRSEDGHSDESSSCLTRSASIQLDSLGQEKENMRTTAYRQLISSSNSEKTSALLVHIESDMLNFNVHKRGLFSKRLTQGHLLSWSKEGITKPLLRTVDKVLKREAPDIFKLIQTYMGDRKSKQIASLNTCLELTTKGWSLPSTRDELYLQLIKQTSDNPNVESLQHGWELLAVCLSFFPPSAKFQILLERYISLQMHSETNPPEVPISIYAKVCQKRLEKILQTGPKKGLRKPTYEEIELSKHTIHFPSMFGASLEEVMAMQRTRYPERSLPWIQTILSDEVLRLHGIQIEGIFRVPGDLDNVNALKVKCDQWQRPFLEDAHLPASLLKLWYRELAEPLIPSTFYDQCIANCEQVEICLRLVNALPEINRSVLMYLIRFLQIFVAPENAAVTKMDVNNLSMVFAPNILRCNSEDARVIFENARREMLFIKILILHLNTDAIDGVI